jgi:sugar-specific transcriptional regulator TrmB
MGYEDLEGILTKNEIEVYIALLKLGESTAGPILRTTGLQNSVFYRTINRLMEKGFVNYILKGKIKTFIATDPQILLATLKDKEEKTRIIVEELSKLQKDTSQTVAEVFVGTRGIKAMYDTLEMEAQEGDEHMFFGVDKEILEEVIDKIYVPLNLRLNQKKVKIMGLDNKEIKKDVTKINKQNNVNVRYTDFPLPPNMVIFRDKIAIVDWGDSPIGILIKNKNIAEKYKKLFKKIWNLSRG